MSRRLTRPAAGREGDGRAKAAVRIIHLGIGNFARAHQVFYTEVAHDRDDWGVAAFTGRSAAVADQLEPADGLYQLVVQAPDGDRVQVISALSAVHAADDLEAWRGYFADPQVSLVTSTITEAGYRRNAAGDLDLDDEAVAADLAALKADPQASVTTAPGKFLAGVMARRSADAGAITFVPCDNIPHNGPMVARLLNQAAAVVDGSLVEWIEANVGVVTTMVDRITPRATDDDHTRVEAATGITDPALVVTEPFTEWVLSDTFASPRPAWQDGGANFVSDVSLHERRKLLMLNGSHSLMAYAASILGHETVFDAINDERVLGWVNHWWDEASSTIDLPADELTAYRAALLDRYRNPRIRHLLAQIAGDGSQKIPIRIVGVVQTLLDRDQVSQAGSRVLAAWLLHLRGSGAPVTDPAADRLTALVSGDLPTAASALLADLGVDDPRITEAVLAAAADLSVTTGLAGEEDKKNECNRDTTQ